METETLSHNLMSQKKHYPSYLESLHNENILNIFDTFHEFNPQYTATSSVGNDQQALYNTFDDFEAGFQKEYFDKSIFTALHHENDKIKKVHLRDLLKIDFPPFNFPQLSQEQNKIPKKSFEKDFFTNTNQIPIQQNKKDNTGYGGIANKNYFHFKSSSHKFLIISDNYNFDYKHLEQYISNNIKHEETSNIIDIVDPKTKRKIKLNKINFKDENNQKRLLGEINLNDMVQRANLLTYPRFEKYYGTMQTILKFFTLLKKIYHKKVLKRLSSANIKSNINKERHANNIQLQLNEDKSYLNKLTKLNNEIYSYGELPCFGENKNNPANKKANEIIIEKIKQNISEVEKEKKEKMRCHMKEKMRFLMFNEEDTIEISNVFGEGVETLEEEGNNDTSIQNANNVSAKKDIQFKDSSTKFRRRSNLRFSRKESEVKEKEILPEFVPQHEARFVYGLKKYIEKKLKDKNEIQKHNKGNNEENNVDN